MSEFKGSKSKIVKSASNEFGILITEELPRNKSICTVWNNHGKDITNVHSELIVEAFDIRQQIPFSLTELKRQRDEMVEFLETIVCSEHVSIVHKKRAKQLIQEATEIIVMEASIENSGQIVKHISTDKKGRTFNNKGMINGKIPVYFETEKPFIFEEKAVLCSPERLTVIGFID